MKIPSQYFYLQKYSDIAFGCFTEAKDYNLYCTFENFDTRIPRYTDTILGNLKNYNYQIIEVATCFTLYPDLCIQAVKALKEIEKDFSIKIDLIEGSYEKIAGRIK